MQCGYNMAQCVTYQYNAVAAGGCGDDDDNYENNEQ
jgi:hypothetical protein